MIAERFQVCVDCYLMVGAGHVDDLDDAHHDEIAASVDALVEANNGRSVHCGDGDGDVTFSWAPCECCGSSLGGSRHEIVVLVDDE